MAVTVRERKLPGGGSHWQADIRVRLPDGNLYRERLKAPGNTRGQAMRWARQREAHILRHGVRTRAAPKARKTPTFADFVPRFMADHIDANRLSPTTRRDYEATLRNHLIPLFGDLRLDKIEAQHVQALKRRKLAASTTNKVLNHLKAILKAAVKWGVIESAVEVTSVKQPDRHPKFYDFTDYRKLVAAATDMGGVTQTAVLLGGDAGLRCGEILGLRWSNVHLDRRKVYICDNLVNARDDDGNWIVRTPKGGRPRWIPMSAPLEQALRALPRLGEHVITNDKGHHLTPNGFSNRLRKAQKTAGVRVCGPHILRHTFCSHLVLRGVHVRTIQKLAGHAELSTTEVYMHLVSEVEEDAIRRLRQADGI